MKTYFPLFLIGAIVGTLLDGLQTWGGVAYYTQPTFLGTPWWVPLLFGAGVVLIGVTHVRFHPINKDLPRAFSGSVLILIVASLITAGSGLSHLKITLILAGLYLFSWGTYDRTLKSLGLAIGTALIGPLTERGIESTGLYQYNRPDILGVPYWLPFLYLHISAAGGFLGRLLLKR